MLGLGLKAQVLGIMLCGLFTVTESRKQWVRSSSAKRNVLRLNAYRKVLAELKFQLKSELR